MNSSLTAIELGILSGSLIWGVTASQVFSYTESGKRDPVWLKSFVACIWLMETIHTAFSWVYLHTVTISDRDSPGKVGNIEWSFAACIVIQDCLSAAVQSLYAYRIYKISGRLLLAITQWIGALLRVIFILILLGYAIRAPSFEAVVHNHRGVTIVAVATSAWVDLLNTAMLCCVLVKRRRSGMKR
ncbi:hypothetical protein CERSUDRAFT_114482 [Gelatoporia subvermispora B]|uniref:Uncharacterized protein n=1 Tax=Ceriporiopsis subvermispora (strain B) TaxID=914234 RepID=M2QZZ7_CERS8|nr:hypothetical protein CERSUDRAFT_114482 [Gelatoporia subvermispora B]